jgi:hypothetical protein
MFNLKLIILILLLCLLSISISENFQMDDKCLSIDSKNPIDICMNYNCCNNSNTNKSCYCESEFNKKCQSLHQSCLKELNYNDDHKNVCNDILSKCCKYQNELYNDVSKKFDNPINKQSSSSLCNYKNSNLTEMDCAKMSLFYPNSTGYIYGNLLQSVLPSIKQCSVLGSDDILLDTSNLDSKYYKKLT